MVSRLLSKATVGPLDTSYLEALNDFESHVDLNRDCIKNRPNNGELSTLPDSLNCESVVYQ